VVERYERNLGFGDGCSFGLRLFCLGFLSFWLSLLGCLSSSSLGFSTIRRGPEGKVVAEQLHDECAIAVGFLGQRVELSNSVIESLLGEMACTVGGVQDLVVEDGEVEGQAKADGVGWGKLGLGNVGSILEDVVSAIQWKSEGDIYTL
jgi:hypothetical protein